MDLNGKYVVPFYGSKSRKSASARIDEQAAATIVANAPNPYSVAITWEGGEPAEFGTENVKFTVSVTMPDNEGDIFKYTKAGKANDALAKLQDEVNGVVNEETTILTYNDFTQSGKIWSASKEITADAKTEHKFTLTVPAVVDILGRIAKEGQKTDYTKSFSIDKRNPDLKVF